MQLNSLLPKILGFLIIILTLALGPTIYTSNGDIILWGVLDPFIGLEVTVGFGAFIIIFSLLISGGIFAIAGMRGKLANTTVYDLLKVIASVIVIIVMLAIFPSILDYCDDLITAAIAAGDNIGEVGFGLVPIIVYVGVLATATASNVMTYRKLKGGSSKSSSSLI
jgi:hypothetical protein